MQVVRIAQPVQLIANNCIFFRLNLISFTTEVFDVCSLIRNTETIL